MVLEVQRGLFMLNTQWWWLFNFSSNKQDHGWKPPQRLHLHCTMYCRHKNFVTNAWFIIMNCINQKKSVIFRRGTVHYTEFGLTSPLQRSDEYLKHIRTIQASFGVWFNPDIPVRIVALPSFLHLLWKSHLHKNPYVQKSRACCLPFIQIKNWCYYLAGVTLLNWKNVSSYSKKTIWEAWCSSGFESCFHREHCLSSVLPGSQFSSYFS